VTWLSEGSRPAPTGISKILHINWSLALLLTAVACAGFLMLYSVADGDISVWARPQMIRFGIGFVAMFVIGMIHIHFWRGVAPFAYIRSQKGVPSGLGCIASHPDRPASAFSA